MSSTLSFSNTALSVYDVFGDVICSLTLSWEEYSVASISKNFGMLYSIADMIGRGMSKIFPLNSDARWQTTTYLSIVIQREHYPITK